MNIDKVSLGPPTGGASEIPFFAKKNAEAQKPTPDSFGKALDRVNDTTPSKAEPEVKTVPKRGEPQEDKLTSRDVKKTEEFKGEETRKTSPKQKAMLKFMDSMESEFGIPPERIVEAMAKLNDEDLVKAPEETFSQVIENLDLEDGDEAKAQLLYAALLVDLKQMQKPQIQPFFSGEVQSVQREFPQGQSLEENLHAMALVPQQGQNPATKMMLSSKEQRANLNSSLDRMNEKFFMRSSEQKVQVEQNLNSDLSSKGAMLANPESQFGLQDSLIEKDQMGLVPNQRDLLGKADLPLAETTAKAPTQQAYGKEPAKKTEADSQDAYGSLIEKLATLGGAAKALGESVKSDPQNAAALKMESALQGSTPMAANISQLMAQGQAGERQSEFGQNSNKDNGFAEEVQSTDSVGKPEAKADGFFATHLSDDKGFQSLKEAPLAAGAAGATVNQNPEEKTQNMQQLINQAQYVMKKGGGEAVVKLTPEGLGQVHLKVMVQDGKVNVEMAAETKEAKKILESSLSELRSSLGAHKLHVDTVKVDVGNQMSSSTDSQQQKSEFKFDQGREQARQFLNNFGEENSAKRGGFYGMPELKGYGARKNPDPIGPASEMSATQRRYAGTTKGQGLNLVA